MAMIMRHGVFAFAQVIMEGSFEVVLLILISSMGFSISQDAKNRSMRKVSTPYTRELLIFYSAVFLYNFSDIVCTTLESYTAPSLRPWIHGFMFCYYLFGEFQTVLLLYVVHKDVVRKAGKEQLKALIMILYVLQIPLLVMLFANPFTEFLFYIDADNYYQRAAGYWIWTVVTVITFVACGAVMIVCWKNTDRFFRRLLSVCVILLLVGFAVNLAAEGRIYATNIVVTVAAMITFTLYENYRTSHAVLTVKEMEELQRKAMLSQIQPHFLHNTLTAIIYHSDKDAGKTRKALIEFSKYLRQNVESISTEGTVPFSQELEHVKAYLYLEKLRFEDDLEVEYDIQDQMFSLPVLTLQPLVENAVRHGIRRNKGNRGKVMITTERAENCHIVRVTDNGRGFDPDKIESMDDTHVGIRNVRTRLESECRGELEIVSSGEWGTQCTIRIPVS